MRSELKKTLKYFNQFGYKPTFEEVYSFYPAKISKKGLKDALNGTYRYTPVGYHNKFSRHEVGIPTLRSSEKVLPTRSRDSDTEVVGKSSKFKISLTKIARVRKYLNFISKFSEIRLIGLSGSVSMMNAKNQDDIDLFIISAKNRIWTARFIANTVAWIFGLKRKRGQKIASDKVCLNLFFSESSLKIDKKLQTEYMAHEVLQMIPIMDVNQTYRKFLHQNEWILKFFPNVQINRYLPYHSSFVRCISNSRADSSFVHFGNVLETVLKKIQLAYMSKTKGDEKIERDQLWFHPRDYSRIVKSRV